MLHLEWVHTIVFMILILSQYFTFLCMVLHIICYWYVKLVKTAQNVSILKISNQTYLSHAQSCDMLPKMNQKFSDYKVSHNVSLMLIMCQEDNHADMF